MSLKELMKVSNSQMSSQASSAAKHQAAMIPCLSPPLETEQISSQMSHWPASAMGVLFFGEETHTCGIIDVVLSSLWNATLLFYVILQLL